MEPLTWLCTSWCLSRLHDWYNNKKRTFSILLAGRYCRWQADHVYSLLVRQLRFILISRCRTELEDRSRLLQLVVNRLWIRTFRMLSSISSLCPHCRFFMLSGPLLQLIRFPVWEWELDTIQFYAVWVLCFFVFLIKTLFEKKFHFLYLFCSLPWFVTAPLSYWWFFILLNSIPK